MVDTSTTGFVERRIHMDVLEKIIDILCDQLDLDREQVTEDSEIIDDLGADSLDIVDLVMTLEEEFDTEITDEMIEGMKTVGDVARYVEEHL
jgi:acyl carrier protein